VRAGAGIYYLPSRFDSARAPWAMPLASIATPWVPTKDNGVTRGPDQRSVSERLHVGPGNMPQDQAQAVLVGGSLGNMPYKHAPFPYQSQ